MFSIKSSPESTPIASMSSLERIETGKAPVILAPLIWLPVTTTSSTSSSAEKIETGKNIKLNRATLIIIFISPPKIMIYKKNLYIFYINQWTKAKFWLDYKVTYVS